MLGETFLNDLLSNAVDSPVLLSHVNFKALQYSTHTPMLFHNPQFKCNYRKNEQMRQIMSSANENLTFTV